MKIPGFVDLQVNGYCGLDFSNSDITDDACAKACQALLRRGTAAFLPTIITSNTTTYRRNLAILAEIIEDRAFKGKILGIHAEGPFISRQSGAVGAHDPAWVKRPSLKFFDKMQTWAKGHIKLITLAAEARGAAELTQELVRQGVVVSLGHQMASYDDLTRLADAGAVCISHLGNGMPNEVHRHHNLLLAGLAENRLAASIITDGHHLPALVVKTIIAAKTTERLIVISDTSPIAGCRPGVYQVLGNRAVLRPDGLLHNPDKKCMVGSSFTMLECMNWLITQKLLSPSELIEVGFVNPLKLIRIRPATLNNIAVVEYNKQLNRFLVKKEQKEQDG